MHFFKSTPLAAFAAAVLFFSTASAVPQGKGKPAPKPAPKPAVKHTENFKALKGSKNAPANFNHGQRYAILDLLTDGVGSSALQCLEGAGSAMLAVGEAFSAVHPQTKEQTWDFRNVKYWGVTKKKTVQPRGAPIHEHHHAKHWESKLGHLFHFKGIVRKAESEITAIAKKLAEERKELVRDIVDCRKFAEELFERIR